MKASTADVRGVAVGVVLVVGAPFWCVRARVASSPTTFHARPGCG